MLTGPLQNNKRPSFSGHETFPMRYGWLTKMMDYFDPNQQKNDLIIKTQSISPVSSLHKTLFGKFLTLGNEYFRGIIVIVCISSIFKSFILDDKVLSV